MIEKILKKKIENNGSFLVRKLDKKGLKVPDVC